MSKLLAQLREVLTQIIEGTGDAKVAARQGRALLDQFLAEGAGRSSVKVLRGGAEVEYSVEKSNTAETLAERRKTGKAQPFRCPRSVYDGLVQVMAYSDRALPLDELLIAVAEMLRDQPPDFQMRVPLRLWMQIEPPLIVRSRARYRPVDAKSFADTANELWNRLRK